LHHRQHLLVEQRLEGLEVGVQPDIGVERQHLVLPDRQRRPALGVLRRAVGDDGVDAVVAAAELDDHQLVVARGQRGVGGARQEAGRE